MNDVMPVPLPKCFWPVRRQPSPSRRATAFERLTSPPLPGSDVIVPHQAPLSTVSNTSARCFVQAAVSGSGTSGMAKKKASTAGCIELTRATEGSPWARAR